jgi:Ca2+-binding EF-hand superfamily protein
MSKLLKIIAGVSLLWAFQGTAIAEDTPPPGEGPQGMLGKADANKDGKVTFDEFKSMHDARMQEHFNRLDANGDGAIDKSEAEQGRQARGEKRHEKRQDRRNQ